MKISASFPIFNEFVAEFIKLDPEHHLRLKPSNIGAVYKYSIERDDPNREVYIQITTDEVTVEYRNFDNGDLVKRSIKDLQQLDKKAEMFYKLLTEEVK